MQGTTIYLRNEPTNDELSILAGVKDRYDVVAYSDKECTTELRRWGWYQSNRPRAWSRQVMMNLQWNAVQWLAPKLTEQDEDHAQVALASLAANAA